MPKTKSFLLRITPEELITWKEWAHQAGISLAQYIRQAVILYRGEPIKIETSKTEELWTETIKTPLN